LEVGAKENLLENRLEIQAILFAYGEAGVKVRVTPNELESWGQGRAIPARR